MPLKPIFDAEIWRSVVDYEGSYEVSNQARVRSIDRVVHCSDGAIKLLKGVVLKQVIAVHGGVPYYQVTLSKHGRVKSRKVCHLVLEAFVGQRPEGMECCHGPKGSTNDWLANLRWDTVSANKLDTVAAGNHRSASKTRCKNGHEFTPENTAIRGDNGGRRCLPCKRDTEQRSYRNRKARANA